MGRTCRDDGSNHGPVYECMRNHYWPRLVHRKHRPCMRTFQREKCCHDMVRPKVESGKKEGWKRVVKEGERCKKGEKKCKREEKRRGETVCAKELKGIKDMSVRHKLRNKGH